MNRIWLKRLEFEAQRQGTDSGRLEMRCAQLTELLKTHDLLTFEERAKAKFMVTQLSRWLGSFVVPELNSDACKPAFDLDEIDKFTAALTKKVLEAQQDD